MPAGFDARDDPRRPVEGGSTELDVRRVVVAHVRQSVRGSGLEWWVGPDELFCLFLTPSLAVVAFVAQSQPQFLASSRGGEISCGGRHIFFSSGDHTQV